MAETEIRINKRTLERGLFTVIIIVLAVLLILRWDATPTAPTPDVNVTELQEQNAELSARVQTLETDLVAANTQIETLKEAADKAEQQAAQEPQPQDDVNSLSGEFDVDWTITMDGNKVERVLVVAVNGLEDDMDDMLYQLHWKYFNPGTVRVTEQFNVDSGESWTRAIVPEDGNIISRQEDDDVLILEIFDKEGDLVALLEQDA